MREGRRGPVNWVMKRPRARHVVRRSRGPDHRSERQRGHRAPREETTGLRAARRFKRDRTDSITLPAEPFSKALRLNVRGNRYLPISLSAEFMLRCAHDFSRPLLAAVRTHGRAHVNYEKYSDGLPVSHLSYLARTSRGLNELYKCTANFCDLA